MRFWIVAVVVAVIVFASVAIGGISAYKHYYAGGVSAEANANAATLDPRFVQEAGSNADNKVDADFEAAVAKATADGKPITDVLLERAGHNAQRLAIWSSSFGLYKNPNDWKGLVVADGSYLSNAGIELYYKLEGVLTAKGTSVAEAQAPATGYNSSVKDGVYVVSEKAGITGNRKAVMVTLKDGSVVYIMFRCGNNVYPSRPNLPKPPTTQPPRVTPPTTQPPRVTPPTTQPPRVTPPTTQTTQPPRVTPPTTQPPRVTPKDPTQDPAPRGNAPVGGGRNQDPGPGVYIPPSQMEQPPAQPRVNPSPPTTQHTVTPPPPTGSTPDPTPPAPPETLAPPTTPDDPATGTVTPPGM